MNIATVKSSLFLPGLLAFSFAASLAQTTPDPTAEASSTAPEEAAGSIAAWALRIFKEASHLSWRWKTRRDL